MSTDATECPAPTGWPWEALFDAARRFERADRAALEAGTAGDVTGRCAAELDRDLAAEDFRAVREDLARMWLAGFRAALEYSPAAVAELLGGLPAAETVVAALDGLEDRVDAAEDVIVNLATRRAV